MHVVTNKKIVQTGMISECFLKEFCYVEDERRAGGRLFQARGPATANARSPIVERHVDGTQWLKWFCEAGGLTRRS